jgi:hypothetical protein
MAYAASCQMLQGFLATGASLSKSKSKGALVEAPEAPEGGARFLAFPRALSSLGMGPPLNRGLFKNLLAAASS